MGFHTVKRTLLKPSTAVIKSAQDVLSVLAAFIHLPLEASLRDISVRVGLPKPKTYRALSTLVESGFVEQDPASRKYRLHYKILDLADALLSNQEVRTVARPVLEALANGVGEGITLAVPAGNEVVFVDRIHGGSHIRFFCDVGKRLPLHVGAAAKAILSFFPPADFQTYLDSFPAAELTPYTITTPDRLRREIADIRKKGYSFSNQEVDEGISAVGAAILDRWGAPVAGIAIASLSIKMNPARVKVLGEKLGQAVQEISMAMGYRREFHAAR
jgi:IclR family acetate operon transcriptional repressor